MYIFPPIRHAVRGGEHPPVRDEGPGAPAGPEGDVGHPGELEGGGGGAAHDAGEAATAAHWRN